MVIATEFGPARAPCFCLTGRWMELGTRLKPGASAQFRGKALINSAEQGAKKAQCVATFLGRSAALLSGALQTRDRSRLQRVERSRLCGAPLRIAREDGRRCPCELRAAPRPGKA